MGGFGKYIISITAVSICCSLVRKLVGERGNLSGIIQSLCGIVLAITAISPITKIKFNRINTFTSSIQTDADFWVQEGVALSNQELRTIITQRSTAYILEKASSYDCSIDQLEVELSSDSIPVPNSIKIYGTFTPNTKSQLSGDIETNLGIPKENQQWIYQN